MVKSQPRAFVAFVGLGDAVVDELLLQPSMATNKQAMATSLFTDERLHGLTSRCAVVPANRYVSSHLPPESRGATMAMSHVELYEALKGSIPDEAARLIADAFPSAKDLATKPYIDQKF